MAGRVQKTCAGCGKVFTIPRSQAARGQGNFCSRACQRLYPQERRDDHRSLPRDESSR
jgi:hypothetical protein